MPLTQLTVLVPVFSVLPSTTEKCWWINESRAMAESGGNCASLLASRWLELFRFLISNHMAAANVSEERERKVEGKLHFVYTFAFRLFLYRYKQRRQQQNVGNDLNRRFATLSLFKYYFLLFLINHGKGGEGKNRFLIQFSRHGKENYAKASMQHEMVIGGWSLKARSRGLAVAVFKESQFFPQKSWKINWIIVKA